MCSDDVCGVFSDVGMWSGDVCGDTAVLCGDGMVMM